MSYYPFAHKILQKLTSFLAHSSCNFGFHKYLFSSKMCLLGFKTIKNISLNLLVCKLLVKITKLKKSLKQF